MEGGGHVGRMNDNRWTYRVTFWYLTHKKRKKGKTKDYMGRRF